jgi:hypothetical protein
MLNKDQILLERAYLTLSKAVSQKPTSPTTSILDSDDKEEEGTETIVSSGPVTEPAPGVDVDMVDLDHESEQSLEDNGQPTVEPSVDFTSLNPESSEEQEEDEMALDNLNSIRESIVKVASFCASGGHLEAWQQQKLAIAMDNLAGIARSLRN